jgi:hypothetical protein
MIDFLNWTHLSKTSEPDSKPTVSFSAGQRPNETKPSFSSIELIRSIARWENEGGAIVEMTQPLPA